MSLSQLAHLSVIYAEDDPFTRALYEQMLRDVVTDLRLAVDGSQALALFQERPCDLLLTDMQMPQLDGLQLCEQLRKLAPELPLIIISSHDDGNLLLATINLGIDAYLLKPVNPEQLHKTLLKAADRLIARRQLEQAARTWSQTFDAIPDLIAILDPDFRVVTCNRAAQEKLQLSLQEARGQDYCILLHPDRELPEECLTLRNERNCCLLDNTTPVPMLDGYYNVTVTPILDEQGEQTGLVHVSRNVTEKTEADLAVLRSEARYRLLLNSGHDAILVHGIDDGRLPGRFTEVNDAACRMFGYSRDELLQLQPKVLNGSDAKGLDELFIDRLLHETEMLMELELRKKDGALLTVELSSHLFFLDGRHQVLTILRDCTERKRQEAALRYISTHDQLTGAFNRSWFEAELARLACGRIWPVSFIMVDLNDLKQANDRLGHAAGDELLCRAVRVLKLVCRADEMIARVGGDEFTLLLPGVGEQETATIMERIRRQVALEESIMPQLSLSLGMAVAQGPEQLHVALAEADQQMYRDKAARRCRNRQEHKSCCEEFAC